MMHLTKPPRKDLLALCGQTIDNVVHQRTMLPGFVDCPRCMTFFRALPNSRSRTPRSE